jgi:hypothetical protein
MSSFVRISISFLKRQAVVKNEMKILIDEDLTESLFKTTTIKCTFLRKTGLKKFRKGQKNSR